MSPATTHKTGGSACRYIKKAKQCITPCKVVHNNKNKNHKWFCKKTKRCSGKDPKHRHKKKSGKRTKKSKGEPKPKPETAAESEKKEEPAPATTSFTAAATNTISNISSNISNSANNLFGAKPEEEKKSE